LNWIVYEYVVFTLKHAYGHKDVWVQYEETTSMQVVYEKI
jgi:hypothetical protein